LQTETHLTHPARTFWVAAGCALIFVLIYFGGIATGVQLSIAASGFQRPVTKESVITTANPVPTVEPQPTSLPTASISETLAGARPALRVGRDDAPIQMVIFADPQCPFCKQLATEVEPQLIAAYVKTGKAALTYRHFTFLGPESERIAVAMECAGEQGKFLDFYHYAFDHQQPENGGLATDALMGDWAKAVQLDLSQFTVCTQNQSVRERVQADTAAGRKLGVVGTPTLFINGRPMPGALPFEFLKGTIEGMLK